MIIAIDGFSGTGKGTLAKDLAKILGYRYIDSGSMYRAVTYFALEKGIVNDAIKIVESLPDINISFDSDNCTILNGKNVESSIRGMEVSNNVSVVSKIPEVRSRLVQIQRDLGQNGNIVMDGRDIGSVVFPDADIKIFMNCSPNIRAKRRMEDFKGKEVSFEDILKNIKERDLIDINRKISPLKKLPESIEMNNSNMTKKEQLEYVLDIINKHEKNKN